MHVHGVVAIGPAGRDVHGWLIAIRASRRGVWFRLLAAAVAGLMSAAAAADWIGYLREGSPLAAIDFALYRDAAGRWVAGDGFYLQHQFAPYMVQPGDVLYPPTSLLLFVPFLALPAWLFWAIPLGIVALVVAWQRPEPLVWPFLVLCVWFPATQVKVATGNPVLWVAMLVALATRWPAFAPWALLKFTVAPFALLRADSRHWWLGAAALIIAGLLFLPMWIDYARVLANAREPLGPLYSLQEFPMLAIPVVAWLGSTTRLDRRRAGDA